MAADKNVNNHELILDYLCCHHQKQDNQAKSNQIATDKNVNNHELILDFVCCHHQQVECPLSQIKWQRI